MVLVQSLNIEQNLLLINRFLSMKKLGGKVAIITGGASGIGEATARHFSEHGALRVVIADIQDDKGEQVAESIGSHCCSYIHCDVTNEDQVKAMVDWTILNFGQLDIMFSNAGVVSTISDQTILDLDLSESDYVFSVNARGMAACVKHAARAMVERRVKGAIVCTASMMATRGGSKRTDYIMSKHAVIGLMRSASKQLGMHGIRVNCVSPSAVATPMFVNSLVDAEAVKKAYRSLTNLKGIDLTANHVAEAVLFLASEDSAFITGHNLVVDGGLTKLPDAQDYIPSGEQTSTSMG